MDKLTIDTTINTEKETLPSSKITQPPLYHQRSTSIIRPKPIQTRFVSTRILGSGPNIQDTSPPITPVECLTFEDQATGLSSPKLKPNASLSTINNQRKRDESPFRELNLDDGKHITENFLFKKDWSTEKLSVE
ncbi:14162_t:CDS:2 [Ambispora leptoticha]|uniref:14162_t:CDS:1 n=1 Tax=Ambispora leptoticha TaxID=144679 RepID=A0A9N9FVV8_9GLOM|nr:14162_t:CDS:2 [Ambispora leptoticha]